MSTITIISGQLNALPITPEPRIDPTASPQGWVNCAFVGIMEERQGECRNGIKGVVILRKFQVANLPW